MMRFYTLLLLSLIQGISDSQETINIPSTIKHVTVYQKGAQVTREATVDIPKGTSKLVFENITGQMNTQGIQVKASDDVMIVSVSHKLDYIDIEKRRAERITNYKQKKIFQDSLSVLRGHKLAYLNELEMILANKSIGGKSGVDVSELLKAADFFRNRLTDIRTKINTIDIDSVLLRRNLNRMNRLINEYNPTRTDRDSKVIVMVSSRQDVRCQLDLQYFITTAGWKPLYDIRFEEIDIPLSLIYRSKVQQNTDEDWTDVQLTLSTGNPTISNLSPNLSKYLLTFDNYYKNKFSNNISMRGVRSGTADYSLDGIMVRENSSMGYATATIGKQIPVPVAINKFETTISFDIEIPYTIPSDNKPYDVTMVSYDIDAEYLYKIVPKLSDDAYLMARFSDWTDYHLLSGKVNLFFKGVYQGDTYLDVKSLEDTLSLSIGRDKDIVVERKLLKDYTSKKFFASKKKVQKAWGIIVKNNKSKAINLIIEDQYPISRIDDIKVELLEHSGAKVSEDTGKLTWEFDLGAKQKTTKSIIYAVRYPKKKRLLVQ